MQWQIIYIKEVSIHRHRQQWYSIVLVWHYSTANSQKNEHQKRALSTSPSLMIRLRVMFRCRCCTLQRIKVHRQWIDSVSWHCSIANRRMNEQIYATKRSPLACRYTITFDQLVTMSLSPKLEVEWRDKIAKRVSFYSPRLTLFDSVRRHWCMHYSSVDSYHRDQGSALMADEK